MKRLFFFSTCAIAFFTCASAWAKLPYVPIQFPRDDAAHFNNVPYPVSNMNEWWYFNGRFKTKDGRQYGFYLNYSYMQFMLGSKKVLAPIYVMQITDINNRKVYAARRISKASESKFATDMIDIAQGKDVTLQKHGNTFVANATLQEASNPKLTLKYSLEMTPVKEPLLINKTGLIDAPNNTNTYYYSYTKFKTTGYVQIGDEKIEIDPEQCNMWMDHQWGDYFIPQPNTVWFLTLVQLDNGMDLLAIVPFDPKTKKYTEGMTNIIMPDNSRIYTTNPKLYARVVPGEDHPQYYELSIPEINLQLSISSLLPKQNLNWISESASTVEGTFGGTVVHGSANAESTVDN